MILEIEARIKRANGDIEIKVIELKDGDDMEKKKDELRATLNLGDRLLEPYERP